MIEKRSIENNLKIIKEQYYKQRGSKLPFFYSKQALMEVCGWIEQSMDGIVRKVSKKYLKVNMEYVENDIIKDTWGFCYKDHFREMLIRAIGIINVERLEKKIDDNELTAFKNNLGNLNSYRRECAHTYIKGITPKILSPTTTIKLFNDVSETLKKIEDSLIKMKL